MSHNLGQIFTFLVLLSAAICDNEKPSNCQSCHSLSRKQINVHLIPYSNKGEITSPIDNDAKEIISSVVKALVQNPERRFAYSDIMNLWKFWRNTSPETDLLKNIANLIETGQLEIINGAWSQSDEAVTTYQSIIDDFTLGFRRINDITSKCPPSIGWKSESFHSREQASIFMQFGFDALWIKSEVHRKAEFLWKSSENLEKSHIFTTSYLWDWPSGFDFDGTDKIHKLENDTKYNLPKKIKKFKKIVTDLVSFYSTNNIPILLGGKYKTAEVNFENIDDLIGGLQNEADINVFYSTPSCFITAVHESADTEKIEFAQETDDFMPKNRSNGYFTTRPELKTVQRTTNRILQAAKQLVSFYKVKGFDRSEELSALQEAVSAFETAVVGISEQVMINDYSRLLNEAVARINPIMAEIILDFLTEGKNYNNTFLEFCLEHTTCRSTQNERFLLVVYNPLERSYNSYIHLLVPSGTYTITGFEGSEIVDLLPYEVSKNINQNSTELIFLAKNIPPLGAKLYYIKRTSTDHEKPNHGIYTSFGTNVTGFTIDDQTCLLKAVRMNDHTVKMTQKFLGYDSNCSNIFCKEKEEVSADFCIATKGRLVDQVRQSYGEMLTQVIRVYKGSDRNFIEFNWFLGKANVSDIVTRFEVENFDNRRFFYTDSNGREMIRRESEKNARYYPVTSKIVIKDELRELEVAVLNDRAQGGASLSNGQIELMLNRRVSKADVDNMTVAGYHHLIFGPSKSAVDEGTKSTASKERILSLTNSMSPLLFLGSTDLTFSEVQEKFKFSFEGLQTALPDNIHILTFEPWNDDTYLLRLEHILQKDEDNNLAKSVTVQLTSLFSLFEIEEVTETMLGANVRRDDYNKKEKYSWNLKDGSATDHPNFGYSVQEDEELEITLEPMQIRTFLVKVKEID